VEEPNHRHRRLLRGRRERRRRRSAAEQDEGAALSGKFDMSATKPKAGLNDPYVVGAYRPS
jgi:hypothetical protein